MESKDEILINTQIGFFFEKILEKPEDYYSEINTKLGNIFDNTPTILPIPKDPRLDDVPVATITSSDGVYTCNIARSRIDLIVAGEGRSGFEGKKNNISTLSEDLISYLDENNIKIKRIGFITRFFIEEDSQDKVIEKILSESFISLHKNNRETSDFIESYIRYVNKINFINMPINNYTTIEKFFADIGVEKKIKGVLITRDFNTNPEVNFSDIKSSDFTITSFINESENRFNLNQMKNLLWPIQE